MPVTDLRIVVVAVIGGAVLGWGLGRKAEDRIPVLWSTGLAAGVGIVAWVWWAVTGDPAGVPVAAPSLTLGGAVATGTATITGRRDGPGALRPRSRRPTR